MCSPSARKVRDIVPDNSNRRFMSIGFDPNPPVECAIARLCAEPNARNRSPRTSMLNVTRLCPSRHKLTQNGKADAGAGCSEWLERAQNDGCCKVDERRLLINVRQKEEVTSLTECFLIHVYFRDQSHAFSFLVCEAFFQRDPSCLHVFPRLCFEVQLEQRNQNPPRHLHGLFT